MYNASQGQDVHAESVIQFERRKRGFIKHWDQQQRKRQQSVGRESVTPSEDGLENTTE